MRRRRRAWLFPGSVGAPGTRVRFWMQAPHARRRPLRANACWRLRLEIVQRATQSGRDLPASARDAQAQKQAIAQRLSLCAFVLSNSCITCVVLRAYPKNRWPGVITREAKQSSSLALLATTAAQGYSDGCQEHWRGGDAPVRVVIIRMRLPACILVCRKEFFHHYLRRLATGCGYSMNSASPWITRTSSSSVRRESDRGGAFGVPQSSIRFPGCRYQSASRSTICRSW